MWLLSDEVLIDAYHQAMDLQLEDRFIQMLLSEIRQRDLSLQRNLSLQSDSCTA